MTETCLEGEDEACVPEFTGRFQGPGVLLRSMSADNSYLHVSSVSDAAAGTFESRFPWTRGGRKVLCGADRADALRFLELPTSDLAH